ncbi:MAG: Imm1 family immunity protein [Candidatus Vecturithrix sp.]|jgi:hypothetical protein|nr:Imm1 family immunity protein [Candidatus Vecturithrix sp.]
MWRLRLRDFSTYEILPASTWADVEQGLRRLDGFRHDDARLEYAGGGADEACLNVGGGEAERVVVGIQTAGADYLHLIDPAQSEALTTQSVGGQETPLPGKFYVPLALALHAARYFYQYRTADPALPWVAPGVEEEC